MTDINEQNWREFASCKTVDPELFFPVGTTGPAVEQIAEAKAVCASCPARGFCLGWAIDRGIDYGVWGGMDEDERRELRRANRKAVA